MTNVIQNLPKSKIPAFRFLQPIEKIISKDDPSDFSSCTPLGRAFRESIQSLIEKNRLNSLSNTLSYLLIHSMNFNPDKLSVIASFYTKVKYCICNIENIELGKYAYSDDTTKVDLDTFFALKEFLAYLKTTNCHPDKIKILLDLITAYTNYLVRARVLEKNSSFIFQKTNVHNF